MQTVEIVLPDDIVFNAKNEIYSMLLDKAISKVIYYKSKEGLFEDKYKMDIDSFRSKVEGEKEDFELCDELIVWEAHHMARIEWEAKYKALKLV